MTRVDFYILPDADEDRRQVYLCRLVEKAWRTGHRIWIHIPEPGRAAALDERLWTFSQGSFVPHERAGDEPADPSCPILLGGGEPDAERQLLVNEGTEVPACCERFHRIAEVVNQADKTRRPGRDRYAAYRDRGYELHHHRVN